MTIRSLSRCWKRKGLCNWFGRGQGREEGNQVHEWVSGALSSWKRGAGHWRPCHHRAEEAGRWGVGGGNSVGSGTDPLWQLAPAGVDNPDSVLPISTPQQWTYSGAGLSSERWSQPCVALHPWAVAGVTEDGKLSLVTFCFCGVHSSAPPGWSPGWCSQVLRPLQHPGPLCHLQGAGPRAGTYCGSSDSQLQF